MDKIKNFITSIMDIDPNELNYICSYFKKKKVKKLDLIIQSGQPNYNFFYVNFGLFRKFHINEKGHEITYFFPEPGMFISSLSIIQPVSISEVNIQAIADAEVLVISREDLNFLYRKFPIFNIFAKYTLQDILVTLEKRVFMLMNYTAEDRYKYFKQEFPNVLKNVQLKYLSSYLGITPQHLSRIRKLK